MMSLTNLGGGRAVRLFDETLADLMENIGDGRTQAEKDRKITLSVTFSPSKDRSSATFIIETKAALAPLLGIGGIAELSYDGDTIEASEQSTGQPLLPWEYGESEEQETA